MKTEKLPAGTIVKITGGVLADPEGNGINWEAAEPIPTKLRGMLGELVEFNPIRGLNLTFAHPYPFQPWKDQILAKHAREHADGLTVVKVLEGPYKDALLNPYLLSYRTLTPLEALAAQA